MRRATPSELIDRIDATVPERPRLWSDLLRELDAGVLTPMSRLAHPRYFAFIPASSTFPGALGDLIASALDIDAGSWSSAAGPSHLESVVLDWFKQWIGYPADAARRARERRLGGERHRARVRPRDARRRRQRRCRRLRLRSDALLGRAGGPAARASRPNGFAAFRPTADTGCAPTPSHGRSPRISAPACGR